MHLTLLDMYGDSPFPRSVELTKRWIEIKGMLLGLTVDQVKEHQDLVRKESEGSFSFNVAEPRRTGRLFKAWSELKRLEIKERKFDALIHFFAEQTDGAPESFELASQFLMELDKEDKKPKEKSVFKWAKIWRKPLGLLENIEGSINDIQRAKENEDDENYVEDQSKSKKKRKKRSESLFLFDETLFTDIKRVILCAMAKSSRFTRTSLMAEISKNLGVPLIGDYLNQVQQYVDQTVTLYQKVHNVADQ